MSTQTSERSALGPVVSSMPSGKETAYYGVICGALTVAAVGLIALGALVPYVAQSADYWQQFGDQRLSDCKRSIETARDGLQEQIARKATLRNAISGPSNNRTRAKRQADCGNCCIPGHPGAPGKPGKPGRPGPPGRDGAPGRPGYPPIICKPVYIPPCNQCPPGPPGRPGDPGPPGNPGRTGSGGQRGNPGRPGNSGAKGTPGEPGSPGNPGAPGSPGNPAVSQQAVPGTPGQPGEPGPAGLPGDPGRAGNPGSGGFPGRPGNRGPPGKAGDKGSPGSKGPPGRRGSDGKPGVCPTTCGEVRTYPGGEIEGGGFIQVNVSACSSIIPERFRDYDIVIDAIPDPPLCLLEVVYMEGNTHIDVYLGNTLYESQAAKIPARALWPANKDKLYTLVMFDLDSESRNNPNEREVLLWMVINVPGADAKEGRIGAGDTLVEYFGFSAKARTGRHRIVYLAYEQKTTLSTSIFTYQSASELSGRFRFKIHSGFIVVNRNSWAQLTPVAGNFLMTQYLDGSGKGWGYSLTSTSIDAGGLTDAEIQEYNRRAIAAFGESYLLDYIATKPKGYLGCIFGGKGGISIDLGTELAATYTFLNPTIASWSDTGSLYTIVMIDIDAPSPGYLHWMVINAEARGKTGYEIVEYDSPKPPSGTGVHRYVLMTLDQVGHPIPEDFMEKIQTGVSAGRSGFSVQEFMVEYKLTFSAGNYFTARYDN